jgi:hypothetical protein
MSVADLPDDGTADQFANAPYSDPANDLAVALREAEEFFLAQEGADGESTTSFWMAIAMGAAEGGADGVREVIRDEERFLAECERDEEALLRR